MKEFVFKNKVYGFPEAWEELTAEEFITVCGLLQRFVKGEIDMDTFKFLAVGHITGYKPHWWPPSEVECVLQGKYYFEIRVWRFCVYGSDVPYFGK